jgi:hypothetical protein
MITHGFGSPAIVASLTAIQVSVVGKRDSFDIVFFFQNYLNESLKLMDKSYAPSSLGLHSSSLDLKPIQLDSKLQALGPAGLQALVNQSLEKK